MFKMPYIFTKKVRFYRFFSLQDQNFLSRPSREMKSRDPSRLVSPRLLSRRDRLVTDPIFLLVPRWLRPLLLLLLLLRHRQQLREALPQRHQLVPLRDGRQLALRLQGADPGGINNGFLKKLSV